MSLVLGSILFPTVVSGGGEGNDGGFTTEQRELIVGVMERLNSLGTPTTPLVVMAAPVAPEDMVTVFFDPTAYKSPAAATCYYRYVNNSSPLLPGSVELTRKKFAFTKSSEPGGLAWAHLPLSSAVDNQPFAFECPDANLNPANEDARCYITEAPEREGTEQRYWLMSELLDRDLNPFTPPP